MTGVIVWVDPTDCDPPHGMNLHAGSDAERVNQILADFLERGEFDKSKPALIAYPVDGRIQLLSGTHRLEAAKRASIKLPVVFWLRSDIEAAWGRLEVWQEVMRDIPVAELEAWTRADLYKKVTQAAAKLSSNSDLAPEPKHFKTRVQANTTAALLAGLSAEELRYFAEEILWHYENIHHEATRRNIKISGFNGAK